MKKRLREFLRDIKIGADFHRAHQDHEGIEISQAVAYFEILCEVLTAIVRYQHCRLRGEHRKIHLYVTSADSGGFGWNCDHCGMNGGGHF